MGGRFTHLKNQTLLAFSAGRYSGRVARSRTQGSQRRKSSRGSRRRSTFINEEVPSEVIGKDEKAAPGLCRRCCRSCGSCCRRAKGTSKYQMRDRVRTPEDNFRMLCALGQAQKTERLLSKENGQLDVNCVTRGGYSGLHAAAAKGHQSVVSLLLEKHANVNILTTPGMSPLMLAAAAGHRAVVEALLAQNADVSERVMSAQRERQALDFAKECGHTEVARMIQARLQKEVAGDPRSRALSLARSSATRVSRAGSFAAGSRKDPRASTAGPSVSKRYSQRSEKPDKPGGGLSTGVSSAALPGDDASVSGASSRSKWSSDTAEAERLRRRGLAVAKQAAKAKARAKMATRFATDKSISEEE